MPTQVGQVTVGLNLDSTAAERQAARFLRNFSDRKAIISLDARSASSALGRISAQASQFTKSMEAANARVLAFTASAGSLFLVERAFRALIKSTIEVEKAITDINVVLNASGETLRRFEGQVFATANKTGQSFQEAAKAALEFSRQGLGVEQTIKRMGDALILARISGLSTADSIEALTAAVNSFNKTALTTTDVINKLARVDANFAVSSADLANALQRVGSTAEAAGVSFDELIAFVTSAQQITQRGGSVIGNALKSIFTRIQRPEVLSQFQELGIAVTNAKNELLPVSQVLQQLAKSFANDLSPAQENFISELTAGLFQINQFKAIVGDLSSQFSIYQRALQDSRSATDEAITRNEELNKTFSSLVTVTQNNLKQFAANVGKFSFGPVIDNILKSLNTALEGINNTEVAGPAEKLGAGILTGIGKFLSGPAALAVGAGLIALVRNLSKFVLNAAKDFVHINSGAQKQAELQGVITALLKQEPAILERIRTGTLSVAEAQQLVLAGIRQETIMREKLAAISGAVARQTLSTGAIVIEENQRGKVVSARQPRGSVFPGFAKSALEQAIDREAASGIPKSMIRVGQSPRLISPYNPDGIGVYNTKDEPGGLEQGISRAVRLGLDPRTHGISNTSHVPGFLNIESEDNLSSPQIKASNVAVATKQFNDLANQLRTLKISFQDAVKQVKKLAESFSLTDSSVKSMVGSLQFIKSNELSLKTQAQIAASGQQLPTKPQDFFTLPFYSNLAGKAGVNVTQPTPQKLVGYNERKLLGFDVNYVPPIILPESSSQLALSNYQKAQSINNFSAAESLAGLKFPNTSFKSTSSDAFLKKYSTDITQVLGENITEKTKQMIDEMFTNPFDYVNGNLLRDNPFGASPAQHVTSRNPNLTWFLKHYENQAAYRAQGLGNFFSSQREVDFEFDDIYDTSQIAELSRQQAVQAARRAASINATVASAAHILEYGRESSSRVSGLFGIGNFGTSRYKAARAFAEVSPAEAAQLRGGAREKLQNRAFFASFGIPIATEAINSFIPQNSPRSRGIAAINSGISNALSFGATGLALSGGNVAVGGFAALAGALVSLPDIFTKFRDTLPELTKEFERLRESATKQRDSMNQFIEVSGRLNDISLGRTPGATVGTQQRLVALQTSSLANLTDENKSELLNSLNKGGLSEAIETVARFNLFNEQAASVADVRKRLGEIRNNRSIFSSFTVEDRSRQIGTQLRGGTGGLYGGGLNVVQTPIFAQKLRPETQEIVQNLAQSAFSLTGLVGGQPQNLFQFLNSNRNANEGLFNAKSPNEFFNKLLEAGKTINVPKGQIESIIEELKITFGESGEAINLAINEFQKKIDPKNLDVLVRSQERLTQIQNELTNQFQSFSSQVQNAVTNLTLFAEKLRIAGELNLERFAGFQQREEFGNQAFIEAQQNFLQPEILASLQRRAGLRNIEVQTEGSILGANTNLQNRLAQINLGGLGDFLTSELGRASEGKSVIPSTQIAENALKFVSGFEQRRNSIFDAVQSGNRTDAIKLIENEISKLTQNRDSLFGKQDSQSQNRLPLTDAENNQLKFFNEQIAELTKAAAIYQGELETLNVRTENQTKLLDLQYEAQLNQINIQKKLDFGGSIGDILSSRSARRESILGSREFLGSNDSFTRSQGALRLAETLSSFGLSREQIDPGLISEIRGGLLSSLSRELGDTGYVSVENLDSIVETKLNELFKSSSEPRFDVGAGINSLYTLATSATGLNVNVTNIEEFFGVKGPKDINEGPLSDINRAFDFPFNSGIIRASETGEKIAEAFTIRQDPLDFFGDVIEFKGNPPFRGANVPMDQLPDVVTFPFRHTLAQGAPGRANLGQLGAIEDVAPGIGSSEIGKIIEDFIPKILRFPIEESKRLDLENILSFPMRNSAKQGELLPANLLRPIPRPGIEEGSLSLVNNAFSFVNPLEFAEMARVQSQLAQRRANPTFTPPATRQLEKESEIIYKIGQGVPINDNFSKYIQQLNEDFKQAAISGQNLRDAMARINDIKAEAGTLGTNDIGREFLSQFAGNDRDLFNNLRQDAVEFADTMKEGFKDAFRSFALEGRSAVDALRDYGYQLGAKLLDASLNSAGNYLFRGVGAAGKGLSNLFGAGFNRGGRVKKYSSGGVVTGGSGIKDDVPALLSDGEYVLTKATVQELGVENLNQLNYGTTPIKSSLSASGDSLNALLTNAFVYDNPTRPTTGAFDIDPRLSTLALEDENNPQNALRDERFNYLISYLQEKNQYDATKRKALRDFRRQQDQMLISAYIGAAVNIGGGFLSEYGAGSKRAGAANAGLSSVGSIVDPTTLGGYSYSAGTNNYQTKIFDTRLSLGRYGGGYMKHYAGGGRVFGGNSPTDNVPALLTGGEYVLTRAAVQRIGKDKLDQLNNGQAKGYADGGLVGGYSVASQPDSQVLDLLRSINETLGQKEQVRRETGSSTAKTDEPKLNVYNTITINIDKNGEATSNVQTSSNRTGSQSSDEELAKKLADGMQAKVYEILNKEIRNGGLLKESLK